MLAASLSADAPKGIYARSAAFCQIQNYGAITAPATLKHIARLASINAPRWILPVRR